MSVSVAGQKIHRTTCARIAWLRRATRSHPPQLSRSLPATTAQKPATRAAALKATLDENRELIVKAIGQGYSATGLAKKLKAAGVSTSVEALRRAVQAVVADSMSSAKADPVKAPTTRATRPQAAAPVRETTPIRARATTPLRSRASDNAAFDAEERTA